jgi:hypothetical protein
MVFAIVTDDNGQPVSIPPWFDFATLQASAAALVGIERFQSHLGSILPHVHVLRRCPNVIRFQSHLGSILPCSRHLRRCSVDVSSFNPTLVRFCPRDASSSYVQGWRVSIPPWFDFATSKPSASSCVEHHSVSIPPWFDFAPRLSARIALKQRRKLFQSHLGSILPGIVQHGGLS